MTTIGTTNEAPREAWLQEASLNAIATAIENNHYEATAQARQEDRTLLLNEYNLFPVIEKLEMAGSYSLPGRPQFIQPNSASSGTLLSKVKSKVRQWTASQ